MAMLGGACDGQQHCFWVSVSNFSPSSLESHGIIMISYKLFNLLIHFDALKDFNLAFGEVLRMGVDLLEAFGSLPIIVDDLHCMPMKPTHMSLPLYQYFTQRTWLYYSIRTTSSNTLYGGKREFQGLRILAFVSACNTAIMTNLGKSAASAASIKQLKQKR